MSVHDKLLSVIANRGAALVALLDPDKLEAGMMARRVAQCEEGGVDAFFVGGSLMHRGDCDAFVKSLKEYAGRPVIGFPGSINQISADLDALLYLSVVSGRNPDFLFGQHVYAAPLIRKMNLETISTAYMLVESGRLTTAQYMNHSLPIPRSKPEVGAATALAAEMMGMRMLYADAGSGAEQAVPTDMIQAITDCCERPLVVGGGIRRPTDARDRVDAGASVIVVGTAIEESDDRSYLTEMAAAVHTREPQPIP